MAAATATASKNIINLQGSTQIVKEFFFYSVNSILYQRGIYPTDKFSRKEHYGLAMMVFSDEKLKEYLDNFMKQLSDWLMMGEVQRLVLVITGADSGETLERWVFDVTTDQDVVANPDEVTREKSEKEITSEIQAIIRQITASVTFLPLLNERCTFDMLVYTNRDTDVPKLWEESDPKYIPNASDVRLRSFTTKVHKVDTCVTYKNMDDEV